MGDANEPCPGIADRIRRLAGGERLQHRLLHDVLAVDDRPGHASAVAMQHRAHLGEESFELRGGVVGQWRQAAAAYDTSPTMESSAARAAMRGKYAVMRGSRRIASTEAALRHCEWM